MNRICTFLMAAVVMAAPLSATAQDRGRGERGPGPGQGRDRDRTEQSRPAQRQISVAEAQAIAESRARGATFVGYAGSRGGQYVFRFDRGGQLFDITVPMTGR